MSERPPSLRALAWANGEELTRWVETTGQRHRDIVAKAEALAEDLLSSVQEEMSTLELMPYDQNFIRQCLLDGDFSPEKIEAVLAASNRDSKRGALIEQLGKLSAAIAQMSKCRQAVTVGAAAVMTTALSQLQPAADRTERNVTGPSRRKLGLSGALAERDTMQAVDAEVVTTE